MDEDLIQKVELLSAGDPLRRVSVATEEAQRLSALGDSLVDHFVQRARDTGASWSEIGSALGVSKQAAQQRFAGRGLAERLGHFGVEIAGWARTREVRSHFVSQFEPAARAAVVRARDEAASLLHHYVGTEHLLLGIVADPGTVGSRALASFGVTFAEARQRVEQIVGLGKTAGIATLPFTPRARLTLELALSEALRRSSGSVGTGDLATALLRQPEGLAVRILLALGVDLDGLRERIVELEARSDETPGA